LSSVSLAISTLTSDKRYAGAGIFIIFLLSDIVAGVLNEILNSDRLVMVSVWDNIGIVGRHLFGIKVYYNFPWYESLLVLVINSLWI